MIGVTTTGGIATLGRLRTTAVKSLIDPVSAPNHSHKLGERCPLSPLLRAYSSLVSLLLPLLLCLVTWQSVTRLILFEPNPFNQFYIV